VPIRRAVASEDASALWQAAHALLMSSSGMMGASMFAELCHELEALGHAAILDRAPGVLSQLAASYSERVRGSRRRSGQRTLIWNLKENEWRPWL
jgi:HPt (histidine-containing phosphotransfer) domain-containing protein